MQPSSDNLYVLLLLATAGTILLAIVPVLLVIIYRNRALRQLKDRQEAEIQHQKALVQAIVQSQEKERSHIGSELHDNIVNSLMRLNLLIEKEDKRGALQLSAKIVTDIRCLSHGLSPATLRLFGLEEALQEMTEPLQDTNQPAIELTIDEEIIFRSIAYDKKLHLYRIIQELVTNTLKYADAKHIAIRLQKIGNAAVLSYTDDGKGFEYANTALRRNGMYNIESRLQVLQAKYQFHSAPGEGVQVEINLPVSLN